MPSTAGFVTKREWGWSPPSHLPVTEKQRQCMLFKSHDGDDALKAGLVQGLLISEEHPSPPVRSPGNASVVCRAVCHCVPGAAHTPSHHCPRPPQASTLMPTEQVRKVQRSGQSLSKVTQGEGQWTPTVYSQVSLLQSLCSPIHSPPPSYVFCQQIYKNPSF